MNHPAFDYRSAELYCLFIEGHRRNHLDSDLRLDSEEKDACPFCNGELALGMILAVIVNESL